MSTEPDTHGPEAAPQAPTLIRADRTQQGKCYVFSSSIRFRKSKAARHEEVEQLRTRSAVRCLKELRFELNLPPYRPIKAPERTPLARMR
jgi:hypothetical protein